ncbi:hypothetical protein [Massilia pseudoviolaceinigra]|uniref:hypothetical protein n=1 Tax=Massilia pseudoviolaceinigra TaxID=3057165 RepID=UPI0027966A96|nr:hypothetical protein [Massilia sp. CCM 9206]MDQ1924180.1 hypothetical protein [Massilia sp. CCM 9206]
MVVAAAGFLLWCIYLYRGGEPECMFSANRRYDWSAALDGGRVITPDGSPEASIREARLGPNGVIAEKTITRATVLIECKAELADANRIVYLEMRSPDISAAVAAWHAGTNNAPGFKGGPLKPKVLKPFSIEDLDQRFRTWNPAYVFEDAPDWFVKNKYDQTTFVAFWGTGHLFKGNSPDQYFWVGYGP